MYDWVAMTQIEKSERWLDRVHIMEEFIAPALDENALVKRMEEQKKARTEALRRLQDRATAYMADVTNWLDFINGSHAYTMTVQATALTLPETIPPIRDMLGTLTGDFALTLKRWHNNPEEENGFKENGLSITIKNCASDQFINIGFYRYVHSRPPEEWTNIIGSIQDKTYGSAHFQLDPYTKAVEPHGGLSESVVAAILVDACIPAFLEDRFPMVTACGRLQTP